MSDTTEGVDPLTDLAVFPTLGEVRPRYSDVGPDGLVDIVAVARWFEDARVEAAVGAFRRLREDGGMAAGRILLASQRVARLGRIDPGDDHRIGLGVRRVGGSSFTYGYGVFAGETCVATGETVTVFATADGSATLPDALREDLGRMAVDEPGAAPPPRPGPERHDPGTYPFRVDVRARLSDIDTNRHGNNVALLSWYTDAVAGWQLEYLGATPGGPPPELAPTVLSIQYLAEVAYPSTYRLGLRTAVEGDRQRYECGLFLGERCVGLADLTGPGV